MTTDWIECPVERQRIYDDELIARYEAGLPLTKADKTAARKAIKGRRS